MKRTKPKKRRDRVIGHGSPYSFHRKREYLYSQDYRAWFRWQRRANGRPIQERESV
jgi:hypothetical protein